MIQKTLLLFAVLAFTGCSTAINRITENGKWGNSYNYLCPSLTYEETESLKKDAPYIRRHISLAGPDAFIAIDKAKEHIKEHGGDEFAQKVVFSSVNVVYRDSADVFRKKYYTGSNSQKCGNLAYWVTFEFTPYPEAEYRFVVAMDEKFELAEDLEFPYQRDNSQMQAILSPEEAAKIALRKHRRLLKRAEYVFLEYNQNLDSFVWVIGGRGKSTGRAYRERETWRVMVDAETGQVVGTEMIRSVSHGRYF